MSRTSFFSQIFYEVLCQSYKMYRLSQSECFVLADDYTPPPVTRYILTLTRTSGRRWKWDHCSLIVNPSKQHLFRLGCSWGRIFEWDSGLNLRHLEWKKKRAGQGGNIYFFFPFRFLCSQASELKFTLKLRPAESSRKVSLWWFKCEMFRLPWEQTPLKAASLRGAGITALHTCLIQDTKFLTHAIVMTPCALFVLCT